MATTKITITHSWALVRYKTAKWKTVIFLPHLADVAATAKIDIFV